MAQQWRQRMWLDVDALLSSEDVFAMSGDEFKGYFLLLLNQYKSDDGYLPADDDLLRKRARLTKQQWGEAKEAILAKFEIVDEKYSNTRLRTTWETAKTAYEKMSKGGKNGAKTREKEKEVATPLQPPLKDLPRVPLIYSSPISSDLGWEPIRGDA